MNQSDRAWYYAPGPKGPVRRMAVVSGEPEITGTTERVGLTVFPLNGHDFGGVATGLSAVPVRDDYKPGAPVDAPFCTPMDENMLVVSSDLQLTPEQVNAIKVAKAGNILSFPSAPPATPPARPVAARRSRG